MDANEAAERVLDTLRGVRHHMPVHSKAALVECLRGILEADRNDRETTKNVPRTLDQKAR